MTFRPLILALLIVLLIALPPVQAQTELLPAPLYFIAEDNQIHRLERDGVTNTQITTDVLPVIDFDLSPVDGKIAYVVGNNLVVADALGGSPQLLFAGGALELDEYGYPTFSALITTYVAAPRWSADGTHIAFSYGGGINLIPSTGGAVQLLLAVDGPEPDSQPDFPIGVRLYTPIAWSPDSTHLSVRVAYYPEGTGILVLNPANPTEMTGEYLLCCGAATWTPDSTSILMSSSAFIFGVSGLWRIDPNLPEPLIMIAGSTEAAPNLAALVSDTIQLNDGFLYLFYGVFDFDNPEGSGAMGMYRASLDGTNLEVLRSDSYPYIAEALWSPDGSGAVIVAETMIWLATNDSPPVELALTGHNLRWGLS